MLGYAHAGELLLPAIERRLADPELAADFLHRAPRLGLPQGKGDLLLAEPLALHGTSCPHGAKMPGKLPLRRTSLPGADRTRLPPFSNGLPGGRPIKCHI